MPKMEIEQLRDLLKKFKDSFASTRDDIYILSRAIKIVEGELDEVDRLTMEKIREDADQAQNDERQVLHDMDV